MEARSRRDSAPGKEFDFEKIVRSYEIAVQQYDIDDVEVREEFIHDDIFMYPDMVISLYERLVDSEEPYVRESASVNIHKVFSCDPEKGGELWAKLLNDKDGLVAMSAYEAFDGYCNGIDGGLWFDRGLDTIYPNYLQQTDTKV